MSTRVFGSCASGGGGRAKHVLLASVITLACVLTVAYAAVGTSDDSCAESGTFGTYNNGSWEFTSSNGLLTLTGSGTIPKDSQPWSVHIPNIKTIAVNGPTNISNGAFEGYTALEAFTNIGKVGFGTDVFKNCTSLKTVEINTDTDSTSLSSIFNGCAALEDVTLGEDVKKVYHAVFSGCYGLKKVTIEATEGAFALDMGDESHKMELKVVTDIPDPWNKVSDNEYTWIEYSDSSDKLLNGKCGTDVKWFFSSDGGLSFTGTGAIQDYRDSVPPWHGYVVKTISIGDITGIGYGAFRSLSSLDTVYLGGVTSIGEKAFGGCTSLGSIAIPSTVTSISNDAFEGCSSLKEITLKPTSGTFGFHIGTSSDDVAEVTVFSDALKPWDMIDTNDYTKVVYKTTYGDLRGSCGSDLSWILNEERGALYIDGTGEMRDYSDSDPAPWIGSVKSVLVSGATAIGDSAFKDAINLESVKLGDTVVKIGDNAFNGCKKLSSVPLGENVEEIGKAAFSGCEGLVSVTVPAKVKVISESLFSGCSSLKSVTITDGVEIIGVYAFRNCSLLESVDLPKSTVDVEGYAFGGCISLKEIFLRPMEGRFYLYVGTEEHPVELTVYTDMKDLGNIAGDKYTDITYKTLAGGSGEGSGEGGDEGAGTDDGGNGGGSNTTLIIAGAAIAVVALLGLLFLMRMRKTGSA